VEVSMKKNIKILAICIIFIICVGIVVYAQSKANNEIEIPERYINAGNSLRSKFKNSELVLLRGTVYVLENEKSITLNLDLGAISGSDNTPFVKISYMYVDAFDEGLVAPSLSQDFLDVENMYNSIDAMLDGKDSFSTVSRVSENVFQDGDNIVAKIDGKAFADAINVNYKN